MYTKFRSEKIEGRDHSEDLGLDERIILEEILKKYVGRLWTGFRLGNSGEHGNDFGFHRMRGSS
jgi:hypothetical protein